MHFLATALSSLTMVHIPAVFFFKILCCYFAFSYSKHKAVICSSSTSPFSEVKTDGDIQCLIEMLPVSLEHISKPMDGKIGQNAGAITAPHYLSIVAHSIERVNTKLQFFQILHVNALLVFSYKKCLAQDYSLSNTCLFFW